AAANRGPGAGGSGLTGLGGERRNGGKLVGETAVGRLQVIGADASLVHPEAQAFVADERGDADGPVAGPLLGAGALYVVLIDQHGRGCLRRLSPSTSSVNQAYGAIEHVGQSSRGYSALGSSRELSAPLPVSPYPYYPYCSHWARPPTRG